VSGRAGASEGLGTNTPAGVHIAGGSAVLVIAALLASSIPTTDSAWRLGVVAMAVGVSAGKTKDALASAAVVLLGWLVVNGFLMDRLGVLSWHGSGDVACLVVLTAAATAGLVAGRWVARRSGRSN